MFVFPPRISEGIVANLPPEVLLHIFSFLDDLNLYAVGNTCRRWNIVLNSQVIPEQWQVGCSFIMQSYAPRFNLLVFQA